MKKMFYAALTSCQINSAAFVLWVIPGAATGYYSWPEALVDSRELECNDDGWNDLFVTPLASQGGGNIVGCQPN
jgi:hypothetical protein